MTKAHPAEFVRYAKAIAAGNGNHAEARAAAERERAAPRVIEATKSASPAALLALPTWGGNLAGAAGEMSVAFIQAIRPRSFFYSLAGMTSPAPFHSRLVATAMIAAAPHVEDEWIPVTRSTLDAEILTPSAVGSIVVTSQELARAAEPEAFGKLRDELQRGAIAAVDARAFALATAGVTPEPATPAPLADLRKLLNAVNTTGGARLIFACAPDAANAAATAETLTGSRIFPDMGATGGEMLGIEAIVSDGVPAGQIALMDASGFATNAGAIAVDYAGDGTLQMRTDPAQEQAELVSLFQTNSVALRVVASFGLKRMRDNSCAILSGVPAAWASEGSGE